MERRGDMLEELDRVVKAENLSKDVFFTASRFTTGVEVISEKVDAGGAGEVTR